MPALDRAAILAAQDRKTEVVPVPEWGGEVIVKALSSEELDSWEQWAAEQKSRFGDNACPNFRASLVVRTIVNDKGEREFGDGEVEILGAKSGSALDRIFAVAMKLSGRGQEVVDALKKD